MADRQTTLGRRGGPDSIGPGIVTIDPAWRFRDVSPSAGEYFDRRPEDMQGRLVWEVFPELVGTDLERAYRSAAAGSAPVDVAWQEPVHGRWVAARLLPLYDGLAVSLRDHPGHVRADVAAASGDDRSEPAVVLAVDEISAGPAPWADAPEGSRRGMVLVVESDPAMSFFIAENLLSQHRVALAFGGREGLDRALALRPDLILADSATQTASGDSLVGEIRRRAELADTPVVLFTAQTEGDALRVRWLREGAQECLSKPFIVEELRARVAHLVARKHAEDALRWAEARTSGIVSISADAIISIDEAQRITMFNEGAEAIFGYKAAEVLGTSIERLIPERFRAGHGQHVAGFAAGQQGTRRMGRARGAPICGRRKNGEEFPAEAAISKLAVGGAQLFSVTLRDVSEQVRRESEQRFLVEVSAVLASSLEYDATISSIAALGVRSLADLCLVDLLEDHADVPRRKAVSRDPSLAGLCALLSATPPGDASRLIRSVRETARSVLIQQPPVEAFALDETHAAALRAADIRSVMAVPLLVHERLLGVVVLVACAASRPFGPAELGLAEEFAQRAALALESARLYRAAQLATRARDEVLGVVAHDLRGPLGNALMAARLLRRGSEPGSPVRELTAVIEGAATRMNRIIEDLLDATRMDAGGLTMASLSVPAGPIIAAAVEAQRASAAAASIDLRLDPPVNLPEIWADRDRLLQVFDNLIGNAIKFTGPGGHVMVTGEARDGGVLFTVADTGAGIPADHLAHVFDRFWQGRKDDRAGAGLGLAIVKGIVEAHRGRVWVTSVVGHGSAFYFTIPTVAPPTD